MYATNLGGSKMIKAMIRFGAIALATVAVARDSWALTPIPVQYLVDEGLLKKDAVAGTPLTFELYSDSACSSPVYSEVVDIESLLVIERLRVFKPKGLSGPTGKLDRIQHIFVVPEAPAYYLKVTGTGIIPWKGYTCQVQFPAAAGGSSLPCASQVGNEVYFTGCNVNIQNGTGVTNVTNGLGNLVVGYNLSNGDTRSGSHNVVVGDDHTYTQYGGIVAGFDNAISGIGASVTAGQGNIASGTYASVAGGYNSQATGFCASVTGGGTNTAAGDTSSVSGGLNNVASGIDSSISGGSANDARTPQSSILGGLGNVIYDNGSPQRHGVATTIAGGKSVAENGDTTWAVRHDHCAWGAAFGLCFPDGL